MTKVVHIKPKPMDRKASTMVTYFAIDKSCGSNNVSLKYDVIPPKTKTDAHSESHPTDAIIYMVSGELTFCVTAPTRSKFKIKTGDFVFVPAGETHYAENL
ncbi:MAG TPA: cupin domain-containing protein, partial [Nitrososphaerales archaeon]|nr:cupin domain-containing protein [Nitrososphaerales archaeon]